MWELFGHSLEWKWEVTDLESRTSGNITSRSTLCPAVRSSIGSGHCQTRRLTPASSTMTLVATHITPGTRSNGNGPLPQGVMNSTILLLWVPMLGCLPGAAPGGKQRALGARCFLQDARGAVTNRLHDAFHYFLLMPWCHRVWSRTCLTLTPAG